MPEFGLPRDFAPVEFSPGRAPDAKAFSADVMARYFFHIGGQQPHHDEIGENLADDEAAWREALRLARDIENNLKPGQGWDLIVENDASVVFSLGLMTRRGSAIPAAELTAEFSNEDPPELLGYHVAVEGRPVALISLEKLELAGFSPIDRVEAFELCDDVKAGTLLFWDKEDGKLHDQPGEGRKAFAVTTRDIEAGSVVRLSFDGLVMLDGQFNLTEDEAELIGRHQRSD